MKFITEDDLRQRYREAPFSDYPYQEGSRLTPGGRQFLLDRGVTIGEKYTKAAKAGNFSQKKPEEDSAADISERMKLALQTVGARCLQAGVELLETDVLLAQEIFTLEEYLRRLLKGGELPRKPDGQPCTGLSPENFSQNMGSCFEINGFHAQAEQGRTLIKLHYLRCLLQEQEPWLSGDCREGVNCMINRLSQLICRELGGSVCQRKQ